MPPFTYQLDPQSQMLYFADFLSIEKCEEFFQQLLSGIDWMQEEIKMFGQVHKQPRLTAWFGKGLSAYSNYSQEIYAHPWTPTALTVKNATEQKAGAVFNSALINYYRNGEDYMGFHADDEPSLGEQPIIASLSLGAERRFVVKRRSDRKTVLDIVLAQGSLLVMSGNMQRNFKHGMPKSKKISNARINLTFRHIL